MAGLLRVSIGSHGSSKYLNVTLKRSPKGMSRFLLVCYRSGRGVGGGGVRGVGGRA
jgi:hypothetical protein